MLTNREEGSKENLSVPEALGPGDRPPGGQGESDFFVERKLTKSREAKCRKTQLYRLGMEQDWQQGHRDRDGWTAQACFGVAELTA